jgi:hypothetical protein
LTGAVPSAESPSTVALGSPWLVGTAAALTAVSAVAAGAAGAEEGAPAYQENDYCRKLEQSNN